MADVALLRELRQLARSAEVTPAELLDALRAPAVVIAHAGRPAGADAEEAAPSSGSAGASSAGTASPPPVQRRSTQQGAGYDADDDEPLAESERGELRRLEATLKDMSETNDRIMAQNIALLADLEVAQRAVRELRAEKDALAVQLRRSMQAQAGRPA
jgi:small-conductance mechanosensitive channel